MKKGKKIIVVMPAHNAEKTLKASFIKLTKDLIDEIILVDGSPLGPSTDDSAKIASKYPNVKRIEGVFGSQGAWELLYS